jgi:glutamate-5-semialdehyde dehydrogenase
MIELVKMGQAARQAARHLALSGTQNRSSALLELAHLLENEGEGVLEANAADMLSARTDGLPEAMLDRLMLNPTRLAGMADDLRRVAELPDPVGEVIEQSQMPNGLKLRRQRVPLGVLAVIYEARPNVTVDVAGLAIKSGNAVILRGGSETLRTNRALVALIQRALRTAGLSEDAVQFMDDPDRGLVLELLKLYEYIDMVIPRGGAGLHQLCRQNSLIPVITGGIGICHLFVDESADLPRAVEVIRNAKIQRPTVCNALDTALVHRAVADEFLPLLVERLAADGVVFRAEPEALAALRGCFAQVVEPAGEQDFDTEWLSLVLGLKVVGDLDEAIAHIATHSTGHSDGILTRHHGNADLFVARVDSAAVYVNASTRFTDGSQFGLGAEVAISTQRLHARGPMGLRELTTYKWVVEGDWHIRE